MARERDIRLAIRDALVATGAFSEVSLTGLPEAGQGFGASNLAAVAVDPVRTRLDDRWDSAPSADQAWDCTVAITILARHEDVELCDELAEQLANTARNALAGAKLVDGYTCPDLTRVRGWDWQPRTPPERRIAMTLEVAYIEDGWDAADVSN